ncbi:MAG: PQQ-binding-like beta-propeller repeat protein [Bacteroidales bacterium]
MKQLWRNLALVSALFALLFAVLLTLSQIMYTTTGPLDTPALTAMRVQLDLEPDNTALQEQIRELDLLARKVYFTGRHQIETGTWILLFAALVLIVSLRMLYAEYKSLPGKELDPFDAWIMQSLSRKYLAYGGTLLLGGVLLFLFLSQLPPDDSATGSKEADTELMAEASDGETPSGEEAPDALLANSEVEAGPIDESIAASDTLTAGASPTIASETTATTGEISPQTAATPAATGPGSTVPNFRGTGGYGHSPARNIPTDWDLASGRGILWKVDVPERSGYSSPIIANNKVFITGADNEARELFAFDLGTGKLLWTAKADNISGSPASMPEVTEDTGLAAATPATNGKQVCAIFASGDILCTDMNGKRIWAKNLGVPDNHYGHSSSLIIYKGMVIVQMDHNKGARLIALDVATGAEKWVQTRKSKISWASPVIVNTGSRDELITTGNPLVISTNPLTGEQYWQAECMGAEVGPSVAYAAGIVVAGNENATMVGLKASDGSQVWEMNDYLPEVASPVATATEVFIATSYGAMAAYNLQSGELGKTHEFDAQFYASPMIVENKLFAMDMSGVLYILNANKDFALVKKIETGERTHTTPAFVDGKIVIRTEKSLYCAGK